MSAAKYRLCANSFAHFCVDLCCALLILPAARGSEDPALVYVLYNYCAFALQMPIGLLADRCDRNALFAIAGCGLVALGFAFAAKPLPAAVVAGVGNALFHVGGGVEVLNTSGDKAADLGIFVSPGALGLYFGGKLANSALSRPYLVALGLLLPCGLLLLFAARQTGVLRRSGNTPVSFAGFGKMTFLLPALCLFCVVVLRSLAGMTMNFAWKARGAWGLACVLAVVLGKCAGGLALDKFGTKATVIFSLLLSSGLFLLSDVPLCGVAAVFLFNMTMPVTLCLLARRMPGCRGFSFGLLTFALFLGFVPVGLSWVTSLTKGGLAAISGLSLLLFLPVLWKGADP